MASLTYNVGAHAIANGTLDFLTGDIEIILVKSTYTPNLDDTNSVYAAAEISGVSGYTGGYAGAGRKLLGTKTVTNDTALNRAVLDAADPSAWTLGTGDTIGGAIVGLRGTANDTTAIPLFFLEVTPDVPTNGGTFTIAFHADGIGYTQQS